MFSLQRDKNDAETTEGLIERESLNTCNIKINRCEICFLFMMHGWVEEK